MPSTSRDTVGVDGCPAGWVVVTLAGGDPARARVALARTFAAVLDGASADAMIAVDIPIGLPDRAGPGGRTCDVAVRAKLGQRQSAVFSVPCRAAVYASDYGDACRLAQLNSDPPRKVSKQCFNLFPKIREVDALMTPALQARVVECHPEAAFWRLNGEQPLSEAKKVKSQPHPAGLEMRISLLAAAGYPDAILRATPFRRAEAGPDDLLDACACAAAAARIANGEGLLFPAAPETDGRGLRMEIWC